MKNENVISRRLAVKSSLFGLLTVSVPHLVFAKNIAVSYEDDPAPKMVSDRYPAIELDIAAEIVSVSHFNFERLKAIVDPRPELARATWDWGFGDWETAIGAGSHVGRKDIVEYLMSKGARPDIFTFAMLGSYDAVRSMIESRPGVQRILGPHGISLLQHAKAGLRQDTGNGAETPKLIAYLETLGDADGDTYLTIEDATREQYLGDYMYGDGPKDGFSVKLNMRGLVTLGKVGITGGALFKTGDNSFIYNGASSVRVSFQSKDDKVVSLTVQEPDLTVVARKL